MTKIVNKDERELDFFVIITIFQLSQEHSQHFKNSPILKQTW